MLALLLQLALAAGYMWNGCEATGILHTGHVEHEGDIVITCDYYETLGYEWDLTLQVYPDHSGYTLTGCMPWGVCTEGGDEDYGMYAADWQCDVEVVDYEGPLWLILRCDDAPYGGDPSQFDMEPQMTVFEDGSFTMHARLPWKDHVVYMPLVRQ
jgi:hypothetical protein